MQLFDELWKMPNMETIPGGSALNTVRASNYMLQGKNQKIVYYGCIGQDEKGDVMKKALEKEGVLCNFSVTTEHKTGACAVIVQEKERTLVADLAAALKYPTEHLQKNMAESDIISKSKIVYIASFFMTSNYDAMKIAVAEAVKQKKIYGFNLSATFLVSCMKEQQLEMLKHADYVFCNEDEADLFATEHQLPADRKEVARFIGKYEKINQDRPRVVLITQQADPVITFSFDPKTSTEELKEFPIAPVASEKIVDTNGAGDAFVGGFLAAIGLDKTMEQAVDAGNYAARQIIQQLGCNFPDKSDYAF